MKDRGFYLGTPVVPDWERQVLDELMAGRMVAVEGADIGRIGELLGRVSQDSRRGNRQLDIKTGYQIASLVLTAGQ